MSDANDIPYERLLRMAHWLMRENLLPAVNEFAASHQVAAAILGILLGTTIDASKSGEDHAYHAATVDAANMMLQACGYRLSALE